MKLPKRLGTPAAALAALLPLAGCELGDAPEGLARTVRHGGPRVVFDLDARPLPEIPFPNDLATLPDPESPTGRRLNLSVLGPTALESAVREKADRLDGFGTYSPITVRFDAPIDAADVRTRHLNADPSDDAVYLFDVDPDSPERGRRIPLDLGYYPQKTGALELPAGYAVPKTGRFPSALDEPNNYFENDPRAGTSTLLFETVEETDADGDGLADRDEDTDNDGVLDRPNTWDAKAHPPATLEEADALIPFYERETNTLLIRPVVPLREGTTYAVVLSKRLHAEGAEGADHPVESPFPSVNHTRQNEALDALPDALAQSGLSVSEVAFTWAFSTQTATRELHAIRDGLNGLGPLGWLASEFKPDLQLMPWWTEESIEKCGGRDTPACVPVYPDPGVLDTDRLLAALRVVAPIVAGGGPDVNGLLDSYKYVDHIVAGTFTSPDFLVDRDGLASEGNPQDDDESFEIDADRGTAVVGPGRVTFWCTVPRELEYTTPTGEKKIHKAPFPVVFYGHGYGGARFEMLGFAGHHARFGLATCGIDAAGHGLVIPPEYAVLVTGVLKGALGRVGLDSELAVQAVTAGRTRDLNNDGVNDSGGDFWTADTFHTRDMVRQSAVDQLQLLRLLRSFDGKGGLAGGDFDGDGVADLGGADNDYFSWGQSLGGILSVLAPVVDRHFVAAAPVAGGAGLVDIGIRSSNPGVPQAVVLRMMGPLILGDPLFDGEGDARTPNGRFHLDWLVPDTSPPGGTPRTLRVPIGDVPLEDGDVVVVRNLTREANAALPPPDARWAYVRAGQGFRVNFAADAWSASEKRARLGFDPRVEGFQPVRMTPEQVLASGDRFLVEIWRDDVLVSTVDTWHQDTPFQGTVYPEGAPLVAPAVGLGHRRQTPDLRRFFGIAQAILDAGDPAPYARRYFVDPLDLKYQGVPDRDETRALVVPTTGDQNVPVNTEIGLARAMGIVDFTAPRADLGGITEDDLLLAAGVYEGSRTYPRFTDERGPFNFDPDDLDDMTDGLNTTPAANFKLRLTKETPGGGYAAMRMPYTARNEHDGENANSDTHGFDASTASRAFDINTFMAQQISLFFMLRGEGLDTWPIDDFCLKYLGDCAESCAYAPTFPGETPHACAAPPPAAP